MNLFYRSYSMDTWLLEIKIDAWKVFKTSVFREKMEKKNMSLTHL